ncbi:hypothetical protein HKD37_14G040264 [Glycine soja]
MYPSLFSMNNLVDAPSTRTDPQEMYHLLFSVTTTQADIPSTCTTKDVPSNVLRQSSQVVSPLKLCEWGNKRILKQEKGDTKEFRRLVLRSFGKGRRETQKEFRRPPNQSQKNDDLEPVHCWIVVKFEYHVRNPIPKVLTVGNFKVISEFRGKPFAL